MKNRLSVFQEVYTTVGNVNPKPFIVVEHVETQTDGTRSRISSHRFETLDAAKKVIEHNGY